LRPARSRAAEPTTPAIVVIAATRPEQAVPKHIADIAGARRCRADCRCW
jgi:hypothetical protein